MLEKKNEKDKIDELLSFSREEAVDFIKDFRFLPTDVIADKYSFPEGFLAYAHATILVLLQKHDISNEELMR